jgi:hypothetical protein
VDFRTIFGVSRLGRETRRQLVRELAELGDKTRDRALERFRVLQPHIVTGAKGRAVKLARGTV